MLTSLVEKLDELDERIIQDQRMVKATEKWTACMLDKGYRYEEPDEIDSDLEERYKAIVGAGVARDHDHPPGGRATTAQRSRSAAPKRCGSPTPTSTCEKQEIEPVERGPAAVREAVPRARTSGCSPGEARQSSPVTGSDQAPWRLSPP